MRKDQLVKTQLELERAEQEMRSKRAIDLEMEAARAKKHEQESLIEELVSNYMHVVPIFCVWQHVPKLGPLK